MYSMSRLGAVLCCWCVLCISGYRSAQASSAVRAWYYWKTVCDLSSADLAYLRGMHIQKLYIRFFDVDWFDDAPRGAFPVAAVRFGAALPSDIEIVPTVFLTNATVRRIAPDDISTLAEQITRKIQRMALAVHLPPIREIQIDCDWTGATRATYFTLLHAIVELTQSQHIEVSATIRLHQVKYAADTGIPPVARGMLMCYNMASPNESTARNAIFDLPLIENYLRQVDAYPLPLDVALPLFSWGAVFRGERFIMLINNARTSALELQPEFERDRDGLFLAKVDTVVNGQDVFTGERVRIDEVHMADVQALARTLAVKLTQTTVSVAWFHYDPAVVHAYSISDIERTYLPFEFTVYWRQLLHDFGNTYTPFALSLSKGCVLRQAQHERMSMDTFLRNHVLWKRQK